MMIKSMKYMLLYAVATSGAAHLYAGHGDATYGHGDGHANKITIQVEHNR